MYEYLCGFQFDENGDLFLAPVPDSRLNYAQGKISTYQGTYEIKWEYQSSATLQFTVTVPFQAKLPVRLPDGSCHITSAGISRFYVRLQK